MKKEHSKTVHITMGLPASGKSYWSRNYSKDKKLVKHISLDEAPKKYESLGGIIENHLSNFDAGTHYYVGYYNELILDGLFLDPPSIEKVCTIIDEQELLGINHIIIHYWNENRELCLYNDKGRRATSSNITIKNGELSKPNIKELNSKYGHNFDIKLKEHTIMMKSKYEEFKETHGLEDEIKSRSWSNGGTSGNCWNDSMSSFGGDEPEELDQLDDLLLEVSPNITFLQYKIIRKLAEMNTWSEGDYYGGSESYSQLVLNTKDLYDVLVELKIIE